MFLAGLSTAQRISKRTTNGVQIPSSSSIGSLDLSAELFNASYELQTRKRKKEIERERKREKEIEREREASSHQSWPSEGIDRLELQVDLIFISACLN